MGRRPRMMFEQRERAIGMHACRWHISKRRCSGFQCHKSTVSQLLNYISANRERCGLTQSGRPRKTMQREDWFLMTLSRRNRFLSSQKLGCLLRNATGIRVCNRADRNRLHAARLKACLP